MMISAQITEDTLRSLTLGLQSAERGDLRPRDSVISAATDAEIHVDRLLNLLVADSSISETPFGRALVAEVEGSLHQNWNNRHRWLKDAFGVTVASSSAWQALDILVELRNALVHGGGTLTARQSQDLKRRIAIERNLYSQLDARVGRAEILLTARTAKLAIHTVRNYVIFLDQQLANLPRPVLNATLR